MILALENLDIQHKEIIRAMAKGKKYVAVQFIGLSEVECKSFKQYTDIVNV